MSLIINNLKNEEKSLKNERNISPFTDKEVVACVFIGNDLNDSKL